MLSGLFERVRFFFGGKQHEEVDEEIGFHMEREVEANLAAGMSVEEARRQAAIAFRSEEHTSELQSPA